MNHRIIPRILALTALILLLAPARAQDNENTANNNQGPPILTVTGVGELRVDADELRLSLSVVAEGEEDDSARVVMDENSRLAEAVMNALRNLGLNDKEIETGRFTIHPRYSTPKRGEAPRIIGYRVENEVRVRTKKIEKAGEIIQHAIDSGANQVASISFGLADEQKHRADAIKTAAANARADADALAAASGVRLVRALRVALDQPQFAGFEPRFEMMTRAVADAAMPAAPPIQPGQVTLTARVTMVFEISEVR